MKIVTLRNLFICKLLLVLFFVSACNQQEQDFEFEEGSESQGMILAVGDSLTAGYGLDMADAYPAILQEKLQQNGYNYEVVNAGVSGETSSGARQRVDWLLSQKPDIVILVTGANDGLRGIDPEVVDKNIREVVELFQGEGVVVVLAGMQMALNRGFKYVSQFNSIYSEIADDYDCIFIDFFLEDVALKRQYNQDDGLHPTREGYEIIVENIYPFVTEAIERAREEP